MGWIGVAAAWLAACSATQPIQEPPAVGEAGAIEVDAGIGDDPDGDTDTDTDTDNDTDTDGDGRPGDRAQALVEARGVWVTRWDFSSAADVAAIMARVASAGFNQVYFQVRGAADAYYRSSLVPWAAALTGKLGQDPGWDPLQTAIEQAHARGLELHAWINVCTGWKGAAPPGRSRPEHLLRAHPEWLVRDGAGKTMPYSNGNYIFVNPAQPGFQKHIEAVVAEIASFYAIDGLHLDYTRYPGREYSSDPTTQRQLRAARKADPGLDRAGFQREELTRLVQRLRAGARAVRPGVTVSAAVTGIYLDRWGWGGVTQGRVDFHQDSHLWAERGAVDALIPMIYWPPTRPKGRRTDYLTLVEDFAPLIQKVQLLIGINVEAGDFDTLAEKIRLARQQRLSGVVLFAYRALADRGWFDALGQGPFSEPAVAPPRQQPVTAAADHLALTIALGSTSTISIQSGWPSLAWLYSLGPWAVSTRSASSPATCPAAAPR